MSDLSVQERAELDAVANAAMNAAIRAAAGRNQPRTDGALSDALRALDEARAAGDAEGVATANEAIDTLVADARTAAMPRAPDFAAGARLPQSGISSSMEFSDAIRRQRYHGW